VSQNLLKIVYTNRKWTVTI